MATLQKFKHIATQCAIAGSPTRSPTTSPVIHLRRRKTLRMLLSRSDRRRFSCRGESAEHDEIEARSMEKVTSIRKEVRVRRKLKDLFLSASPPSEDTTAGCDKRLEEDEDGERQVLFPLPEVENGAVYSSFRIRSGLMSRRGRSGSLRPVSGMFRSRLLRRAWRPLLVTIPE